uniref:Lysine-specific metallo-endopeptidase domain-containing protein n=1 Tax=Amphimedon queenslandica TaxID=400682 RepID=A0A1X7UIQ7_AMPQE
MACNKALSAVACSFEFTNNANEDLYLLKRNTPLEGLNSLFVSVSLDGRPLEYEGIVIHRLPPTKDEFVLLKAGESISASVQITDAFSIDTDGLYTVQYSRPLQYLSVNEISLLSTGKLRESIVRESVHIHLERTHLLSRPKEQKVEIDYTVYIESCTAASFANGDRNNSGTLDSHKLLCDGLDKIIREIGNDNHYKEWFGAWTSSRSGTVKNTYTLARNGIAGKSITYYNNGPLCQSNYIAYTYKSYTQTTTYLCNLFYGYPTACRGTDYTKEGTLVHEWVHAFAARDDVVYGASNCRNLANTRPDDAIRNAASHEYYYCTGR